MEIKSFKVWQGRSKKKKVQDVVINMYLMEWNGKEQELKAK